ncbi:hypothetical protein GHT06_007559 [Daphnia sinensis]|uniref:Uncharacterized protein n=1 Tax=Daphnia sinensis TaxID=1820382 RepID=A0AAD5KE82_9CRUS|nr:hypothetical protein GHT06_007559 [Daphnia sinensis]
MSEPEPRSKLQKMDKFNKRRRITLNEINPFPGTPGFGAHSSKVLSSGKLPELLNASGQKRKRGYCSNKQHQNSSSVTMNFSLPDKREEENFSLVNYLVSAKGSSCCNKENDDNIEGKRSTCSPFHIQKLETSSSSTVFNTFTGSTIS